MIADSKIQCIIRRVTATDIDDIVSIERESFRYPWKRETFESELYNSFSRFLIAQTDQKAAGFMIFWHLPQELHLINIAVRPEFRRMGIGTRLMEYMLDYAKRNACDYITLEVRVSNVGAQIFYGRFGFKRSYIREKYYVDNDEDAIVMELFL